MIISVVLADEHRIVRDALRGALDPLNDPQIAGVADNSREALALVRDLDADASVKDKLDIRTIAGLTKYAVREGVSTLLH